MLVGTAETLKDLRQIPGENPLSGVHLCKDVPVERQFFALPIVPVTRTEPVEDEVIDNGLWLPFRIVGKFVGGLSVSQLRTIIHVEQGLLPFSVRKPAALPCMLIANFRPAAMSAEMFVKLIDEMVDIKVQQQAEIHLYGKPELARMLEEKRHTNRQRLEMIKQQLVHLLTGPAA